MGNPARAITNSNGYQISSELDTGELRGETPGKWRRAKIEAHKLSKCLGSKALGDMLGATGTLDVLARHAMEAGHTLHERFNVKKSLRGSIYEISRGKETYRGQGQIVYKVGQFALKKKVQ